MNTRPPIDIAEIKVNENDELGLLGCYKQGKKTKNKLNEQKK